MAFFWHLTSTMDALNDDLKDEFYNRRPPGDTLMPAHV